MSRIRLVNATLGKELVWRKLKINSPAPKGGACCFPAVVRLKGFMDETLRFESNRREAGVENGVSGTNSGVFWKLRTLLSRYSLCC
jgi:hypothetical protein